MFSSAEECLGQTFFTCCVTYHWEKIFRAAIEKKEILPYIFVFLIKIHKFDEHFSQMMFVKVTEGYAFICLGSDGFFFVIS